MLYDNILGENVNTINKKIIFCYRLEINTEETKYMVVSRHQNTEQNHNLQITNKILKMWQR